jgi:hypothetical protein
MVRPEFPRISLCEGDKNTYYPRVLSPARRATYKQETEKV